MIRRGPDGHRRRQRLGQWILGERGGSAVEAAVVTPVVMVMFFGIIEMGFVFKDYLAVAGSVRSGVRMASSIPRTSTYAQAAADRVALTGGAMNFTNVQQLWVYKVEPTPPAVGAADKPIGFTDFSNCTTCVKFTWNNATKKFDPIVGGGSPTWPASSHNACSTTLGGPPDRIGVYLKLKHDAFTGFVFSTVSIAEASIMTFEPMPVLNGCKP